MGSKVYAVVVRDYDESWIEGVYHTRTLAESAISDKQRADYARYTGIIDRNRAQAQRWVAAGGGLSAPVEVALAFGDWCEANAWRYGEIEEHEVKP